MDWRIERDVLGRVRREGDGGGRFLRCAGKRVEGGGRRRELL